MIFFLQKLFILLLSNKKKYFILLIFFISFECVIAQKIKGDTTISNVRTEVSKKGSSIKRAARQDAEENLQSLKKQVLPKDSFLKKPDLPLFKFPKPKRKVEFHSQLNLTGFYTDIQNPRSLNEQQYLRIQANPKISLFGLPFQSEIYYTTESNRVYNTNSFSLHFDKEKFLQNLQQQAQQQVKEKRKEILNKATDLRKHEISTQQLENELKLNQRGWQIDSQYLSKLQQQAEEKLEKELKEQEELAKQQLDSQRGVWQDSAEKDKRVAENKKRIDSLRYEIEKKKNLLVSKKKTADSLYAVNYEKYMKIKAKADTLKQQYETAKVWLNKADSFSHNPKDVIANMAGGKLQKAIKRVGNVEKLDIGNIQPQYGELMMGGVPARGIDVQVNPQRWIVKTTLARTFDNFGAIGNLPAQYNRNLAAMGLGREIKSNRIFGRVIWNAGYLWDTEKAFENNGNCIKNFLTGADWQLQVIKKIKLNGEIVHSDFQKEYGKNSIVIRDYKLQSPVRYTVWDKVSAKANVEFATQSLGTPYIKVQRLGSVFQNVANPFLRRDFQEIQTGIKGGILKNKVQIAAFYMRTNDNLKKDKDFTYSTKGFGIQAQSSFANGPNFSINYTPFTQGSAHPDPLLRTNNQYATKMASINYMHNRGEVRKFFMMSYTDGMLQLGDTGSKMHNRNVQALVTITGKSTSVTVNYSKTFTQGMGIGVDTLNFNMLNVNISKQISKIFAINVIQQSALYANGGYRIFSAANAKLQVSKYLQWQLLLGYTRIDKIWELNNADGITARTQLGIRF